MLEEAKTLLSQVIGPQITALLSGIYWAIIAPILSQPTLHWLFISAAVFVAWLYFVSREAAPGHRSVRDFVRYLVPRAVYRHPSAVLDYKFYVLTQLVFAHLRLGQWIVGLASLLYVADGVRMLLEWLLGPRSDESNPTIFAAVLFSLLMTLAFDYARFIVHYMHHRIPLLWEFHKVHHAAEVLTPITGYRSHPVDQMIEFLFRLVGASVVTGTFAYFYPRGIVELTILNHGVITFIHYLTSLLRHSHVQLSFGRLSGLFVSPVMHQLHHSKDPRHHDRNFGFIFSFWDKLAGTLCIPDKGERFDFGLPPAAGKFDTVTALYFRPFVAAFRLRTPKTPMPRAG